MIKALKPIFAIKVIHTELRISNDTMEEKIIALLQEQNSTAISLLYDNYAPALFGVIIKVVRSHEVAEQVLQDTFVKVWKNSAGYDRSKGKLFTWLINIARNTAIDATRTSYYKHFSKTEDIDTLFAVKSDTEIHPEHIGLQQIVETLDDKYRILIEKIYFEGYTQKEIEEELGIPLGTVKTRLRYAINELRTKFLDHNSTELAALLIILDKYIMNL